jgi:hypothetical protein
MTDDERAKQIALNHYRGWMAHDTKEDSLEVAELAYEITAAFAAIREECLSLTSDESLLQPSPLRDVPSFASGDTGPAEEFVLDHTIDAVCPNCGHEFDIPIYTKALAYAKSPLICSDKFLRLLAEAIECGIPSDRIAKDLCVCSATVSLWRQRRNIPVKAVQDLMCEKLMKLISAHS